MLARLVSLRLVRQRIGPMFLVRAHGRCNWGVLGVSYAVGVSTSTAERRLLPPANTQLSHHRAHQRVIDHHVGFHPECHLHRPVTVEVTSL